MYDWFMDCKKYTEKVSQSFDGPVPLHHRFFMWLRRLICADSRAFWRQMQAIRAAGRMADEFCRLQQPDSGLSPEARQRIRQALARCKVDCQGPESDKAP